MGITVRSSNRIPKLRNTLKKLSGKEIQVGVFGNDSNVDEGPINLVTLARVHEFGMEITPKRAEYLTVPVNRKAKGKRAADFPDSFVWEDSDGDLWIVRNVGKDRMEFLFMLTKGVKIPERSFLRAGFDENVGNITKKIKRLMNKVLQFNVDVDVFLESIGIEFAGLIQKKAKSNIGPANHWATVETKGSNKTLRDTGNLIQNIKWKIVE